MKIFDAYADIKIRRQYKKLLLAQGMSLTAADKIYTRMGTYISRMRGVGYDRMLTLCNNENEFIEKLDMIFKDKWKDHLGYAEIPEHFYSYLLFLHYMAALHTDISIDGLLPDDDDEPMYSPGDYESPFIKDGKLTLIINPLLIRNLRSEKARGASQSAMNAVCRLFYPFLSAMTDEDWSKVTEESLDIKKVRSDKSLVRNIAVSLPDGERNVMEGNECFEKVIRLIGFQKLLDSTIKHMKHRLVVREIPKAYKLYFKETEDGLYINLMGSSTEKYKTLRVLDSIFRLNLYPELSNEPVVSSKTRNAAARRKPDNTGNTEPESAKPQEASSLKEKSTTIPSDTADSNKVWSNYNLFSILDEEDLGDLLP